MRHYILILKIALLILPNSASAEAWLENSGRERVQQNFYFNNTNYKSNVSSTIMGVNYGNVFEYRASQGWVTNADYGLHPKITLNLNVERTTQQITQTLYIKQPGLYAQNASDIMVMNTKGKIGLKYLLAKDDWRVLSAGYSHSPLNFIQYKGRKHYDHKLRAHEFKLMFGQSFKRQAYLLNDDAKELYDYFEMKLLLRGYERVNVQSYGISLGYGHYLTKNLSLAVSADIEANQLSHNIAKYDEVLKALYLQPAKPYYKYNTSSVNFKIAYQTPYNAQLHMEFFCDVAEKRHSTSGKTLLFGVSKKI